MQTQNEPLRWWPQPPVSETALAALQTEFPGLPADYLAFLRGSNGGEGDFAAEEDWYCSLWPAEEIRQHNEGYQIERWTPHLLGFGTDGGGVLFAFDRNKSQPWPVCSVPLGDLDDESIVPLASGFKEFLAMTGAVSETLSVEKVSLREKFALFSEHWSPKVVGQLNGQQVKLVKFAGPFVWHQHENEDELFLVVQGRFCMKLRDRDLWLEEGEFCIVPRGVEHCPFAEEEVQVLLFEPAETLNTGNVQNERTVACPETL